jgi:hypothetical protein
MSDSKLRSRHLAAKLLLGRAVRFTGFSPIDEFVDAHLRLLSRPEILIKAERNVGLLMAGQDYAGLGFDYTHSRAICDEIGERLRDVLSREVSEIPAHLCRLVERLAELERVPAPSIVPSTDDMNTGIPGSTVRRHESALA